MRSLREWGILAIFAWAIGPAVFAADAKPDIAALIGRLDSPQHAEREEATRQLSQAGAAAIPAVLAAAKKGSLEAAVRAVQVLEAIYVAADGKNDLPTVDAAELAIDELARGDLASVAARADVVIESHQQIRERRGLEELARLNARFKTRDDSVVVVPRGDGAKGKPAIPQSVDLVIIGPNFRGGDEGLKQVARLKRLPGLYRIEGAPVSDAAIAQLRAALPNLNVQVRGAAKLGIQPQFAVDNDQGCRVGKVESKLAADLAGIVENDVIVNVDGTKIDNFDRLVDLLQKHKPGDVIETTFIRGAETRKVKIKLQGWDDPEPPMPPAK